MTEIPTSTTAPADVFRAARWLDELWNSTARAVSPELIEWQCNTWGSGRGHGDWTETGLFTLVAQAFGLDTSKNYDGRDEMIVSVPLDRFGEIAALIERIGEDPEDWPWFADELEADDPDEEERRRIAVAAELLGRPLEEAADDPELLEALRLV